ncbi:hypothetical protein ACFYYB_32860 [Streptomyces sp. NPDC002886]|uniref:hypothetical protein n=1 Tax=Streptomyces sp. NPDC002886 TaxID=3364667 RepID=UPI00367ED5FB
MRRKRGRGSEKKRPSDRSGAVARRCGEVAAPAVAEAGDGDPGVCQGDEPVGQVLDLDDEAAPGSPIGGAHIH